MKTNNKFITINQARYNSCQNEKMKHLESYKPIPKVIKVVGYILLGYGVLTSPLPSGSQIAILLGCLCLGIDYKVVFKIIKHYSKEFINWFYAPSTPVFILKIIRRSN